MTKKEKKQIISLIKEIKNFIRKHESWRCYSRTKPHNSYSYYELTARWFRKQKYKVENNGKKILRRSQKYKWKKISIK